MESSFFPIVLRTHLHKIAALISSTSCGEDDDGNGSDCRDEAAALRLKMAAVAAILAVSAAGVAGPLAGRERCLGGGGGTFALIKAFSAGVVLAAGFVHVLPGAEALLADPCLPAAPWRRFPFAGFVALLAALGTLAVDLVCTQLYERKIQRGRPQEADDASSEHGFAEQDETVALLQDSAIAEITVERRRDGTIDAMHVAGTSEQHAPVQRDSHWHGHDHDGHGHVHGLGHDEDPSLARRVVVAQILELGIVSHSVIIGLSLGVSQSPCTIKPLVAALSFHQFFQGFALGGCISEGQFNNFISFLMAFFFSVTTPAGIILGTGIASFYNSNSPRALVVEGILDSLSAGILIYMALVDLIAADFLNQRMSSCSPRLQLGSYTALFFGAVTMSALAIWT